MAEERGSLFILVKLQITKEEHLKGITRSERRKRWKSVDPKTAENHGPLLSISHANFLELEISNLSAEEAAIKIMDHVKRLE